MSKGLAELRKLLSHDLLKRLPSATLATTTYEDQLRLGVPRRPQHQSQITTANDQSINSSRILLVCAAVMPRA